MAKPRLEVAGLSEPDAGRSMNLVLVNRGSQTAVAYMLEIKDVDGSGKVLSDWHFVVDNRYYNPTGDPTDSREAALIRAGMTYARPWQLSPGSSKAQISVAGVMYADGTWEGDRTFVKLVRKARTNLAAFFEKAVKALGPYPDDLAGARAAIQRLREQGGGLYVEGEYFKLPQDVLVDAKVPLPDIPMPTRETWEAAARSLSNEAAFYAEAAEEARQ